MKQVSVIIPNWNGKELLGPCLASLDRQQFDDFETIVVDNGSTDGSAAFIAENFAHIRVVRLAQNVGFSAAVNAGIAASRAPLVCLLNNDTEVDRYWLGNLVRALTADPQAGSAASKVLFYSDPQSVNSAGDEFSLFGVAYQRRLTAGDAALFDEPRYVFSACGAAALYRRNLFDRVGVFDESFFAYQEDVDLGFRLQLAGYKCRFVPNAIVYHKYHQTSSKIAGRAMHLRERNKYFVLIKNLPGKFLPLCLPLLMFHEAMALTQALRFKHLGVFFAARWDVWRHLPRLLRGRRVIQRQRVVSDAYLYAIMNFREPVKILFYRPVRAFISRLRSHGHHELAPNSSQNLRS